MTRKIHLEIENTRENGGNFEVELDEDFSWKFPFHVDGVQK